MLFSYAEAHATGDDRSIVDLMVYEVMKTEFIVMSKLSARENRESAIRDSVRVLHTVLKMVQFRPILLCLTTTKKLKGSNV